MASDRRYVVPLAGGSLPFGTSIIGVRKNPFLRLLPTTNVSLAIGLAPVPKRETAPVDREHMVLLATVPYIQNMRCARVGISIRSGTDVRQLQTWRRSLRARFDVSEFVQRIKFALVVAIAISASGAARAERGILDYKIYFGGISVVTLEIDLERTAEEYRIFSKMRTLGVIDQLFPWKMNGYSRGRFAGGEVRPEAVGYSSNWRGRQRSLEVRYDNRRPTVTRVVPKPNEEKRVPVSEADIRGSIDVSSAVMSLSLAAQTARGCTGHVPVFDGRRRYDMVAERIGVEAMRWYGRPGYEPRAVKCRVTIVRRSGFKRVSNNDESAKVKRSGTVWFAPGGNGVPPAPMRIEVETRWGLVIAHLTRVRQAPAKLLH